jgi:hypothetical protein
VPTTPYPIRAKLTNDLRAALRSQAATPDEGNAAIEALEQRIDAVFEEMRSLYGALPCAGDYISLEINNDMVYVVAMRDVAAPGASGRLEIVAAIDKVDLSGQ